MAQKTRVLMVGMYPRVDGKPRGGPESVAEVLADGLARTGAIDMHILTGVPGLSAPGFRTTPAGVQVHTVPFTRRFGVFTGYITDRRRLNRKMRELAPDLVHVHGTGGPYAIGTLERGVPSVLAVRGLAFRETAYERGYEAFRFRLSLRYTFDSLRRARNIIFLNQYSSRHCTQYTRNPQVRCIDNPVDEGFFDVESQEEHGRIVILAVVRRLKGHDALLRAVAKMRDAGREVQLHCVGSVVDAGYYEELQAIVREHGLQDIVHFEEQAARAQVLEHYRRSAVVAVPSLVENAPLVVSEGMAAGKAIVAMPAGGIPEMITDGESGFIVPFSDSDALAEAIGRLLDSPELRSRIGSAARSVAESRFRKAVAVRKTLEFYADILQTPELAQIPVTGARP